MHRPRLLLDCDGVLADFLTPALKILKELTGRTYAPSDFTDWDLFQTVGPEWKAPFYRACGELSCLTFEPYPASLNAVANLATFMDVYVVTAPMQCNVNWLREREEWLARHYGIPAERVIHTAAKHLVTGDLFIDDKPSNVRDWSRANPHQIGLLWDAPYNQLERGLTRAKSWHDVHTIVNTLDWSGQNGLHGKDSRRPLGTIW